MTKAIAYNQTWANLLGALHDGLSGMLTKDSMARST